MVLAQACTHQLCVVTTPQSSSSSMCCAVCYSEKPQIRGSRQRKQRWGVPRWIGHDEPNGEGHPSWIFKKCWLFQKKIMNTMFMYFKIPLNLQIFTNLNYFSPIWIYFSSISKLLMKNIYTKEIILFRKCSRMRNNDMDKNVLTINLKTV